MKKEDLIEKYPELLKEISMEFLMKNKVNQNTIEEKWNEYLEENKPKNQDFKVVGLKLPHYSKLWLNEKTNHFCRIDGKNVIEYEKGLLIGKIFSVEYKGKQLSIGNAVQYLDKTYEIQSFNKERVHLKERNQNNYQNLHISEISRLKYLGVTEDNNPVYYKDLVHWISYNEDIEEWYYDGKCPVFAFPKTCKIFYSKDNALKFIEENNKKVLFVTTDNVEIFDKEQSLYLVNHVNCAMIEIKAKDWDKTRLIYASKQKAEEYILNHSKVLSFDDIKIYLDMFTEDKTILDIVKERLNQK